ncbi:MAG TPA: NUDIX domain-containing protein [Acidimicrobiia bacterium]|jgi:predicted NUDIX family NTP pyrophosphohydrolase
MKTSAGLLPFRHRNAIEVMVAHPGGPLWAKKDAGHWSVIKGEVGPGEEPIVAAAREFEEETGWTIPGDGWIDLGSVRLRSGKLVMAWAVPFEVEIETLNPGVFTMMWRGKPQQFPEIDRVRWCHPSEAAALLNPAQVAFIDRLLEQF